MLRHRRRRVRIAVEPMEERVLLTVFGADDRTRITPTTSAPWSQVCRLVSYFSDGTSFLFSGAVIENFHILTTGQAVYMSNHGGWATRIEVYAGQDGTNRPFGVAYATYMTTYTAWTQSNDITSAMALVYINRNLGYRTGTLGYEAQGDSFFNGGNLNTAGYPTDKSSNDVYMYRAYGPIAGASTNYFYFNGTLDTDPGDDGAPMWRYDGTHNYVDGVVVSGGSSYNFAVRITNSRFNDIQTWIKNDESGKSSGGYGFTDFTSTPNLEPDLVDYDQWNSTNFSSFSPTALRAGQNITIHAYVENTGDVAATNFKVGFHATTSTSTAGVDTAPLIGNVTVQSLAGDNNWTEVTYSGPLPNLSPGQYYIAWDINSSKIDEYNPYDDNRVLLSSLLTVAPDHAPVAVGDSFSVQSGSTLTGQGLLTNDYDSDGDPLTTSLDSQPAHGTVSFHSDGSFTYTPIAGYTGTDSFQYQDSDGTLSSNPATVTINVRSQLGTSGDFDNDGKSDLTLYDPVLSTFTIDQSGSGMRDVTFGRGTLYGGTPVPLTGDVNGDGLSDPIVFDPSTAQFYEARSGASNQIVQFGQGTVYGGHPVPLVGDVDGDGRADPIVYEPSTSTFAVASSATPYHRVGFGQGTLYGGQPIPLVADFDGDGKADLAVFDPRTSTFSIACSSAPFRVVQFGQGTQYGGDPIPMAADVDGDGKADPIVFQPTTALFYEARSAGPNRIVQFGQGTLYGGHPIGLVEDVDGDGKADPIVFQTTTSEFFVASSASPYHIVQFGQGIGSVPVPLSAGYIRPGGGIQARAAATRGRVSVQGPPADSSLQALAADFIAVLDPIVPAASVPTTSSAPAVQKRTALVLPQP